MCDEDRQYAHDGAVAEYQAEMAMKDDRIQQLEAVAEAADTLWIYIDHHHHNIEEATQHFFWDDHQELGKALTEAGYAYAEVGKKD